METPIATQPLIQDFFAAKRKSEVKIPSTQQSSTWDTDKLTRYIKSTWAFSEELSLFDVQLKTLTLLCLATMARPRSDIGRLQSRDVHFQRNQEEVLGVTIHFR